MPDFERVFLILKYNDITQKNLCPNLNSYGDNGQRKVWSSGGSTHCTCQLTSLIVSTGVLDELSFNSSRYCKYSQVLLMMGENIARNMQN